MYFDYVGSLGHRNGCSTFGNLAVSIHGLQGIFLMYCDLGNIEIVKKKKNSYKKMCVVSNINNNQ